MLSVILFQILNTLNLQIKNAMYKVLILISLAIVLISCSGSLDYFKLESPDGQIELEISLSDGMLKYQIDHDDIEIVGLSDLEIIPGSEVIILNSSEGEHDSSWNPVWGQFSKIRNNYKELVLDIECNQTRGRLLARIYNDGVAFRFILDAGSKPGEATLICSYALPDGSSFYVPYGETEPRGPLSLPELFKLQNTKNARGRQRDLEIPIVAETPNHHFVALLESDLYAAKGFEVMHFDADPENGKIISSNSVDLEEKELVSPWRVILVGNSAGDLLTSTTTVNLATPSKLEDSGWIKPGKTLWDWRVHGFTAPDGFRYGINTESYLRFIDFAAENEIEYFLIDAGWYKGHGEGKFEVRDNLDLQKVSEYADKKGVGLILYYDRQRGDFGDEDLFPYYHSLGALGIKYGFMRNNVPFTRKAIRLSAESRLLIDFHDGPLPFTGIRRTFPNAVTREYCHAQQDSRRAFTPESFLKMAFINALTGPLDMNNGNFDITGINKGQREKGPRIQDSYPSTVVSEAARTLIIFSGLVCIPDAPEAYEAKKDLFEFIREQPVGKWDESRVLNSKIGEYITTARRNGDEWFIGSAINQEGGKLDIELNFLDDNQEYIVTYYEDTESTHCKTNPEAYRVRTGTVKKGALIQAELAPGGGHCMWIRPKKM